MEPLHATHLSEVAHQVLSTISSVLNVALVLLSVRSLLTGLGRRRIHNGCALVEIGLPSVLLCLAVELVCRLTDACVESVALSSCLSIVLGNCLLRRRDVSRQSA